MPRTLLLLSLSLCLMLGPAPRAQAGPEGSAGKGEEPPRAAQVTLEDFGYFLAKLNEYEKGNALNVLGDLAADSHLDRAAVNAVMRRLVDEGSPPPEYGYSCPTCFQKRLSELLDGLRLKGPSVPGPKRGFLVLSVDERLVKKIRKEQKETLGATVPEFVRGLLAGKDPSGSWSSWAYPRYHGRGADVASEPVFFSSADALARHEQTLGEPLDAWSLAKYLCMAPPRNRFDPGFLVLEFEVSRTCNEVHIPTAADSENHEFRPTPQSETDAGRTCGGAPEWVCPNFPMAAFDRVRFVPNEAYVAALRAGQ